VLYHQLQQKISCERKVREVGLCKTVNTKLNRFQTYQQPSKTLIKTMKKLEIYEPAMCCSTGVCGVDVDPLLVQFVADLQWLAGQGVEVARHNLSQEPQAFASNPDVVKEMEAGMDRLPIMVVDGHVVSTGVYLSRRQMATKLGLAENQLNPEPHIKINESGCCKPSSGCC